MTQTYSDVESVLDNAVVDDAEAGLYRANRAIFTDEEIFELEMKHVFEGNWVYLAHESQVPNPGDYFTTYMGRQPVVITRSQDGELNLLINACAHRGAMVCRKKTDNRTTLTCPFHGWTFRNGSSALVNRLVAEHRAAGGRRPLPGGPGRAVGAGDPVRVLSQVVGEGVVATDVLGAAAVVVEHVARAPGQLPLLLLVDDASWSDAESLQALSTAVRHHPRAPMLVVLAAASDVGLGGSGGHGGASDASVRATASTLVRLTSFSGPPHLSRIYAKLGIRSRGELAALRGSAASAFDDG